MMIIDELHTKQPERKSVDQIISERYAKHPGLQNFIRDCYHTSRKQRRLWLKKQTKKIRNLVTAELMLLRKYEVN